MSFKVGDRAITTNTTLGKTNSQYHNVVGTVVKVRSGFTLPIMFRPDETVPGDAQEWALFEDELVKIDETDWKKKYEDLKSLIDTYKEGLAAFRKLMDLEG